MRRAVYRAAGGVAKGGLIVVGRQHIVWQATFDEHALHYGLPYVAVVLPTVRQARLKEGCHFDRLRYG